MKLQNLTIIFIIVAIPIILILSYYISLQVDTVNMQTAYNTKLLDSTKEAIDAFEINTVEWNEAYSTTADSKRRDIMASINTFTTSFANNLGIGGSNKETILSYIPAIVYTLYDGYYIYSPAEVKQTVKNENGVTVFYTEKLVKDGELGSTTIYNADNEGKILYVPENGVGIGTYIHTYTTDGNMNTITSNYTLAYNDAATEYKHILKPFSSYSARYVYATGNIDIVVNYTLDNYITIYGTIGGIDIIKSGYLIDADAVNVNNNSIVNITSENGKTITKERLNERVRIGASTQSYDYVYAEDNTKVYFDDTTPFQVSSNGVRTNLSDLSGVKYKKLLIKTENTDYTEIYQALVSNYELGINAGYWYRTRNNSTTIISNLETEYGMNVDLLEDVSAINYYVKSLTFTNWVNDKLGEISVDNMVTNLDTTEYNNAFHISGIIFSNNYGENSVFYNHKREVIKQILISNLNQAITSYSRNSEGEYYLPVLSETDWDQILTNVSIVTFAQGIPIGSKEYNNYAIATSTANREYVDPNEIYLKDTSYSDGYYHKLNCNKLTRDTLIGYRNIDYKVRTYENATGNTEYYYKQTTENTFNYNQACYYCIVQSSLYAESLDINNKDNQQTAYNKALARERYVSHEFRD